MSNSSLVSYRNLSNNYSSRQGNAISRIIIHHMAGNLSLETMSNVIATRESSATYAIDVNGKIGQYVDEAYRPWTTSSWEADKCAVTIEVANNTFAPDWTISDASMKSLIELCVDICKRNGIAKLNYTGDKSGNLHMHKWYAATACPGAYLSSKFPYIAEEVNKKLGATSGTSTAAPAQSSTGLSAYTDAQLADKVIAGEFGNGDARKSALGARYEAVQTIVNQKLDGSYTASNTASKKSVDELANEVLAGQWGNGDDRKNRLTAAGYDYNAVQNAVNAKMGVSAKATTTTSAMSARQFALEVWQQGKHGTGATREAEAKRLGVNYAEAQRLINILASGGSI